MISYRKFIQFTLPWLALAVVMNLVRYYYVDTASYIWMNWNLFLGLVPLLFLFLFEKSKNIYLRVFYFLAWLFFLPNAPYMVTDLIHLRDVGPQWLLWFDGMMIFAYSLAGVFILGFTLIRMQRLLFKESKKKNIFLLAVSLLVSFGIYLGRYVRWNTWHIVTKPGDITTNVLDILQTEYANPVFLMTLIFFTLFVVVTVKSLRWVFLKSTN